MRPVEVTCDDHNGHHEVYVQAWDGQTWKQESDWFKPMTDVVEPLLEKAAAEYVQSNAPWPERTEPCASN
jgi:branched-chain amino acid transport system substrate-binding protein